jgi:hypothetical protein
MSSQLKLVLTVNDNAVTTGNKLNLVGTTQGFQGIERWFGRVVAGAISARARVDIGPTKAYNQITFASFADSDTVTINGVALTAKTSPSGASQWAVGADDFACSNNLVAKINASALAYIAGTVYAYRKATVAFSSFVTTNYVTVNGKVFTGKTTPSGDYEFAIGGSNTVTCQNFVRCINAIKDKWPTLQNIRTVTESAGTATILCDGSLTAAISAHGTVAAKYVVLESIVGGYIGNMLTLAISARGSVTGANFAGGVDGTLVDLKKGILV